MSYTEQYNNLKPQFLKLFREYEIEFEFDGKEIKEETEFDEIDWEELQEVSVFFYSDDESATYTKEELFFYLEELKNLIQVDEHTVRTKHIRQTIITCDKLGFRVCEDKMYKYVFTGDNISIRFIPNPFLVGIFNTQEGNYDKDAGWSVSSKYIAIELQYQDDRLLLPEEEDKIIDRILYKLSEEIGDAICFDTFLIPQKYYDAYDMYWDDDDDFETKDTTIPYSETFAIDNLEPFSPLTSLYIQAKRVTDEEIKFLSYYKVIEYISPLVAKINAYENLNKRLDLLGKVKRDHHYLDSIFSIAKKYDNDLRDDKLCESVFQTCIDIGPVIQFLPKRLLGNMKKTLLTGKQDLIVDELNEEQLSSLQKQIAKVVYSTRNSIVHAKSNYNPTGFEFRDNEFTDANQIMDIVATSIIKWNFRQPEGLRA